MKPVKNRQATLVDLLDRILDKGVIIDADIIIQVAGIPLLGVKLRAALAGMETMLRYGVWEDWDAAQRKAATDERRKLAAPAPAGDFAGQPCEKSAVSAVILEEARVS